MSTERITITVNGARHELDVPPRLTLADLLRERLDLTATHLGCEHGVCGACTVLVDGRRANACLLFAVTLDGLHVTTIEGLAANGDLHPMQAAFVEQDGFQCGYWPRSRPAGPATSRPTSPRRRASTGTRSGSA
jgi:xanthine dehydrogenase YagT iron-sulfur-binding subunit